MIFQYKIKIKNKLKIGKKQQKKTQTNKIYEVNLYRIEGRNRHFYNNSWRLQYPLSIMDITSRQKIIKEIEHLNNTLN